LKIFGVKNFTLLFFSSNESNELREIGALLMSLTEFSDFSTLSGRAMAGMLSTFAEFERDIMRERVKAGIVIAREKGKSHGRPQTAAKLKEEA
jgi:DNA invertase Pin-like site-specific DNA recombinase